MIIIFDKNAIKHNNSNIESSLREFHRIDCLNRTAETLKEDLANAKCKLHYTEEGEKKKYLKK